MHSMPHEAYTSNARRLTTLTDLWPNLQTFLKTKSHEHGRQPSAVTSTHQTRAKISSVLTYMIR
jgi:hypothetical protein